MPQHRKSAVPAWIKEELARKLEAEAAEAANKGVCAAV
jgi:hypothetical protein